jgi:hypothetical protein
MGLFKAALQTTANLSFIQCSDIVRRVAPAFLVARFIQIAG